MNCNTIFNIMKIGLIIISTLLSVLTTYPNDQCGFTMNIIRFCLTYIVTLISILMHFFNYVHLAERHKIAACDFLKIHHDIKQQMCLYKRDRYIAFSYISKIIKQYDTLIMISPIISSYILNKCKHEIEKCSDDMNDIIKTISTVDIIDKNNKSNTPTNPQIKNNYSTRQARELTHITETESEQAANSGPDTPTRDPDTIQISVHNVQRHDPNTRRASISRDPLLISGDIDDDEVNKCNSDQIKELRLKFFKANSSYEYLRFLRNEME